MAANGISDCTRKTQVGGTEKTTENINADAQEKLNLPEGQYKLDDYINGSPIDDNNRWTEPRTTAVPTELIGINKTWSRHSKTTSSTSKQSSVAATSLNATLLDELGRNPSRSSSTSSGSLDSLPALTVTPLLWCKFPKNLIQACKANKHPMRPDFNAMIRTIAQYHIYELKDESRPAVRSIAQSICTSFPKSFDLKLGDNSYQTGVENIVNKVVAHINYTKNYIDPANNKLNKMAPTGKSRKRKTDTDDYACTQYEPGLPADETEETQLAKKRFLMDPLNSALNENEINTYLEATYPTLRSEINHRHERSVFSILKEWPLLQNERFFFNHAERLIGKSIVKTFEDNFKAYTAIHSYLQQYCIESKVKAPNVRIGKMRDILKHSLLVSSQQNSSFPIAVSQIALLSAYFKEDNFLYQLMSETATTDPLESSVTVNTPIVIIKGSSLYDVEARYVVVVEKAICFQTDNFVLAILIAFLCYFVFGIPYPSQMKKTLEFIQVAHLQITCEGKKRISSSQRSASNGIHPDVQRLFNILHDYRTLDQM